MSNTDVFFTYMQSLFISCILRALFQKYIKYFMFMVNPKMIQTSNKIYPKLEEGDQDGRVGGL